MNKNDIVTLTIEDMGTDGEGIGHADGYTLFVKDALPGDVVRAKVIKAKKTYGYARLEEVIEASPDRVEPLCPVARSCGGCQIQHLSYKAQLRLKEDRVRGCLTRIGGISEDALADIFQPILGMKDPWHYRNKAQFPVGVDKYGSCVTGFYAEHSHVVVAADTCYIQAEENEAILQVIRHFIDEYKISVYDEMTGKGLVRHVLTRKGFTTGEIGVCIIINGDKLPHSDVLVGRLEELKVTSISLNINKEKTNVILGEKLVPLYGDIYIYDYIGDVKFRISPLSFFQVNPVQTRVLYGKALEYALDGISDEEAKKLILWDLYCGIGTISLFLAQKVGHVHGVEIVPAAIEDAKVNAKLNGLDNAEFYVGAAEDMAPSLPKPDIIVVDPPRKGCDEKLLKTVLETAPQKVVYVSCDPATLARDIRVLTEGGYKLKKVQPVDQFSHTMHVETVCLLINQNVKSQHYVNVGIDTEEYYQIKENR